MPGPSGSTWLAGSLSSTRAFRAQWVRGAGLLQGLVLADDVDPGATIAAVHAAGLLLTLAGGHVVRISPSLNVTEEELDEGLSVLEKILTDAPRKS